MQPPLTGDHSSSFRVNDCRCMINQFYTEQGKWATIIQEKCVVHKENVRKKFPVFLLLHLNFIDLLQQHWTQNTQEDDQYSNEMILTTRIWSRHPWQISEHLSQTAPTHRIQCWLDHPGLEMPELQCIVGGMSSYEIRECLGGIHLQQFITTGLETTEKCGVN